MTRILPLIAALAIVFGTGVVEGRWSDRAAAARALEAAAAGLGRVPLSAGDWKGGEIEMDRKGLDRAGIVGLAVRRYRNARTGAEVTALLVCGSPGPIAVHGPEVCYVGAGYEPLAAPARCPVSGPSGDELWVCDFRSPGPIPATTLRIGWAWSTAGQWIAADSPRARFSDQPVLYKLYLISECSPTPERALGSPGLDFAGAFLPELRQALFPAL